MTPEDKTIVYRVVGFLEYGTALRYFDELLKTLNPDELKAVDSIIVERPEYAVYPKIANRVQTARSSLVPASESSTSDRARRGLAWVMALARVEAGGVLATFVGHRSPFEAIAPSEFETPAFRQLILDGSQTHYWSLTKDPDVRTVMNMQPNRLTLAYIRRLNLARHFLIAAVRGYGRELNSTQLAEATTQKKQMETLHERFASNVAGFMAMYSGRGTVTRTRNWITECMDCLQYEAAPIAAVSAKSEAKETSQ